MKILVVFTGGTIGSSKIDGVISPDKSNSYVLLDMYSKIDNSVDFTAVQPYNILSENLCGNDLVSLCECIKVSEFNSFHGVIVTHGTDTLQYASSFLSYVFGLCRTPIVVVSANYPLSDSRSNGLDNFCAATEFIKSGNGKGVFVAYKNSGDVAKIHRASRVLPHSPYSDDIYSIFDEVYGEIRSNVFIKNDGYIEQTDKIKFRFDNCTDECSGVMYIRPYVNMKYPEITDDIKAILLEGYHSGTLNTSGRALKDFCRIADKNNVPVFLTGACKGFYYESKTHFNELKINVLPPASPIAMYVKLWLLKRENINDVYLPCGGDFTK